jgi:hypothetical protein
MPANKVEFDWSVLDRYGLQDFLWLAAPLVVGQRLTIPEFHSRISHYIRQYIPVSTIRRYDTKVDSGWVHVGGAYYSSWDRWHLRCIEILFVYNPNDSKITMTSRRFRSLCSVFADTLLHEIIHMRQSRRRKFKDLPAYTSTAERTEQRREQVYLGHNDEIDAYSFNIACELMDKFKNDSKQVVSYLNEDQQHKRRQENSWRKYLKAFDHDHDHTVIRRVKKRVIRYLPYAELGKPYKGSDWINH